jgi:hypothetical protein
MPASAGTTRRISVPRGGRALKAAKVKARKPMQGRGRVRLREATRQTAAPARQQW